MAERINKPRVFLSHSSQDRDFINRLYDDLKLYRIEPWKDTEEIRVGKPWLKVIFEDGIPTCDVVLVYLTQHSIKSKMVEKEIDAALINQLEQSGVSFLPYVENTSMISQLRGDIKAIQCGEWNAANYADVLPSVVAEIWHSYLERVVSTATLKESNERLKLELEVSKLRQAREGSIFSSSEESDFQYIKNKFNQPIEFSSSLLSKRIGDKGQETIEGKDIFEADLLELILNFLAGGENKFKYWEFQTSLIRLVAQHGYPSKSEGFTKHYNNPKLKDVNITMELKTLGLISPVDTAEESFGKINITTANVITEKTRRFMYWLESNGHSLKGLPDVEYVRSEPPEPPKQVG